jgi:hypothetical protein
VTPTKVTLYVPGIESVGDVIPLIYVGGVGVDGKIFGDVDVTMTEVPPIVIPGMSMSYVQLVRFQYPKQVGGGAGQYCPNWFDPLTCIPMALVPLYGTLTTL